MDHTALFDAMKFLGELSRENPELYKETVADLLDEIDPAKAYGTPLYKAIARLSWNVYFEGVALSFFEGQRLAVYMALRGEEDPDWQDYWHVPGSAFRVGDSEQDPAKRVAKEYGLASISFNYVSDYSTWKPPTSQERGSGISRIYLVRFNGGTPPVDDKHRWFDLNHLPKNTVPSHVEHIIPTAAKAFLNG